MIKQSSRYSRYYTYIKPITSMPVVKNYGSTIFTLVSIIVFIFFAIKPTVETIIVLQKKLDNSQQVLSKVTKKVEDLSLGKQNYDNLDLSIKDKIQRAVPDEVGLKSLIDTLEQTALQNQASVSALQIQPLTIEARGAETPNNLAEVGFIFNVAGEYQNLVTLLQQLTTSARLISIDNAVLNKSEEGQGILMSLTGKAYYMK